MASVTITIQGHQCERCSHTWVPRNGKGFKPRVCPKCKSPYWDQPRAEPSKRLGARP